MAIFHCQAKAISRAAGRSATAAAAYRAGVCLKDERTGEIHDYSRKKGIEYSEIITPDGSTTAREQLWNAAEIAEKRKDAKVAREWELALPDELSEKERIEVARDFAKAICVTYGVAADLCIHAPGKDGDKRNHHAHILTTTRSYQNGQLGEKTRVLDSPKTSGKEVESMRKVWADIANRALEKAGHEVRIDPRSLKKQGIDREPTSHLGPAATAMERRGLQTEKGEYNRIILESQAEQKELAALEQQQTGMNAARSRAHQWRQEQARAAAEAQRRAEMEKERQREKEEAERKRRAQEQEREAKAAAELQKRAKELRPFVLNFVRQPWPDDGATEKLAKAWIEKWSKSTPDERATMEKKIFEHAERKAAKELFSSYLRETPGTVGQHGEQLKAMMEKWEKNTPEEKQKTIEAVREARQQQRSHSRMGMGR